MVCVQADDKADTVLLNGYGNQTVKQEQKPAC
jgi:hypothetical protein